MRVLKGAGRGVFGRVGDGHSAVVCSHPGGMVCVGRRDEAGCVCSVGDDNWLAQASQSYYLSAIPDWISRLFQSLTLLLSLTREFTGHIGGAWVRARGGAFTWQSITAHRIHVRCSLPGSAIGHFGNGSGLVRKIVDPKISRLDDDEHSTVRRCRIEKRSTTLESPHAILGVVK